jgi:hypothetical protein
MLNKNKNKLSWLDVPFEACRLAKEAAGIYQCIQDLAPSLPAEVNKVWYNPDKESVFFSYPLTINTDKVASWHIAMRQLPIDGSIEHGYMSVPPIDEPYIFVKQAIENSQVFGPVAEAAQLKPNLIMSSPTPLAAMLAGGLLGGGAGYAAGYLGEQLLPDDYFERGKLRKSLGLLGAGAGMVPGAWLGYDNLRAHPDESKRWTADALMTPHPLQVPDNRFEKVSKTLYKVFPKEILELDERFTKYADQAGGGYDTPIPVDQFNRVIWNDIRSAGGNTDPSLAAAATGLVQAASLSRDSADVIWPADIARIAVGMGSGYASGLLVGKALSGLAGLSPDAQKRLQQAGMFAGVLSNVVPIAFGR